MQQLDRLPPSVEVDGDQRSLVPQVELYAGILVGGLTSRWQQEGVSILFLEPITESFAHTFRET